MLRGHHAIVLDRHRVARLDDRIASGAIDLGDNEIILVNDGDVAVCRRDNSANVVVRVVCVDGAVVRGKRGCLAIAVGNQEAVDVDAGGSIRGNSEISVSADAGVNVGCDTAGRCNREVSNGFENRPLVGGVLAF